MRVVITGATGNVGSSVLRALAADERVTRVVAGARRPPPPPDDEAPKTTWVAADVAVDDLTTVFDGAAALVHLAWAVHPTPDERQTGRVNVLGPLRTVDAALAAGVRTVLYASSVGAYSPAATPDP